MKKNLVKNLASLAMILLVVAPVFALVIPARAADNELDVWGAGSGGNVTEDDLKGNIGLGGEDPRTIAASVINVMLGFLGIIAVVIILLGGFKWMTAGGNEEKVEEAQKLIKAGIIGLIIILAAWGIASFVVNSLLEATGADAPTT